MVEPNMPDAWDKYTLVQAVMCCGEEIPEDEAEYMVDQFYEYNATTANPDDDMDDVEWVAECICMSPIIDRFD